MSHLPPLVDKALADTGYDLLEQLPHGWIRALISGAPAVCVWLRPEGAGAVLLATPERLVAERIGLRPVADMPAGARSSGVAESAQELYRALRLLKTLIVRPASRLSAEVEARLARIPLTERTREVRQRVGQDVFRDALVEFWDGRCALTGARLPAELLRASHMKPWADATDSERLDPFNGLLLAVRYDALFDKGLIAFDEMGVLRVSPRVESEARAFVGLEPGMRLRFILPGHLPYLDYHMRQVAHLG